MSHVVIRGRCWRRWGDASKQPSKRGKGKDTRITKDSASVEDRLALLEDILSKVEERYTEMAETFNAFNDDGVKRGETTYLAAIREVSEEDLEEEDHPAVIDAVLGEFKDDALGTRLDFSTTFHPQSDRQSEHTIQTLEDTLRACVIDFQGGWSQHLPMAEFAYNNNYQASIKVAPFEALYGRKCRSPLHWSEVGERLALGPDVLQEAEDKVHLTRERLLTAQSRQKGYADKRRRDLEFQVEDHVFLNVSPTKGIRRFAYRLALPPNLLEVDNVFHVSVLRKYIFDPAHVLDAMLLELKEDLSFEEQPVRILAHEVTKQRNRDIPAIHSERG
uniref:Integrase catalytic domain-containing protein n=1 Tax=Ananas comosus var. bracteatus TaxID=296719 RepID=A0A6V7PPG1_ANACO|nr:unnamed protein product [Ananas comosus var. bracteatus]